MIRISKIEENSKNIIVNGLIKPSVFIAESVGNNVKIVSIVPQIASIIPEGIHCSEIMINDSPCASANDAVVRLNEFIGSFKGGGGGVSPEDLAEAVQRAATSAQRSEDFADNAFIYMNEANAAKDAAQAAVADAISVHNKDEEAHAVDASDTVTDGSVISAVRHENRRCYVSQDNFKFKIDDTLSLYVPPHGQLYFESADYFNFSSVEKMIFIDPETGTEKIVEQLGSYLGAPGTTYVNMSGDDDYGYTVGVKTAEGNYYSIKTTLIVDFGTSLVEVTKLN